VSKTDSKEGTKRARRKSGLRIPSDDVPRRAKDEESGDPPEYMAESSSDNAIPITHDDDPVGAETPLDGATPGHTLTLSDTDLEEVTDVDSTHPAAASLEPEHGAAAGVSDAPPPGKGPPPAPIAKAVGTAKDAPKGWYDEIFDEDYLRTLPFLTPAATQTEANFVAEALAVEANSQILDVACGYGRHAMELSARGLQVVGLDNSLPLLLRGAEEAQRRGLTIHFVHGDMREMSFEAQFDGAFCLFNSFGYFDDESNKQTLRNIARAIKPGGRFVVDVLNRDYLIADLPARVWWEGDGCVVLEEVDFNHYSSRVISHRSLVFDDGRQVEQEISIRVYSLHELGKLLHAAGFRVAEVSGSMATKGRFFGAQSRDLIVVAERR